jgi:hypothetical protein
VMFYTWDSTYGNLKQPTSNVFGFQSRLANPATALVASICVGPLSSLIIMSVNTHVSRNGMPTLPFSESGSFP